MRSNNFWKPLTTSRSDFNVKRHLRQMQIWHKTYQTIRNLIILFDNKANMITCLFLPAISLMA